MTQQEDVVIIGGGQAGLALSYYLTQQRRTHVVLEQGRVAEIMAEPALGFVHAGDTELDDSTARLSFSRR